MTPTDLKGKLLARRANLEADFNQKRQQADLLRGEAERAARAADIALGMLQQVHQDLAEVDALIGAQAVAAAGGTL